jgi:4-hydroxybenzoate polyprenyltransferase
MRTVRAYLELLRLPNVFTAAADVTMGFVVTQPSGLVLGGEFAGLLIASGCLYLAGMVLNDVFDAEIDAKDRPQRPIPSGRIPLGTARAVGWSLLVAGTAIGWLVSILAGDVRAGIVATALAACIVLYDGVLKTTFAAPLAMGGCRALNVLLGMSTSSILLSGGNVAIAAGVGLYIVGVTGFARREAKTSDQGQLALATAIMLGGIILLAEFHKFAGDEAVINLPPRWYWFWLIIALLIVWRCVRAVAAPSPANVQAAVKHAILSLIVLDAAVCYASENREWAFAILALLVPAMFLGRWIDST